MGGVSSARNLGISSANGEYVCFVDSDDTVDKNYVEKLLSPMIPANADCVIAGIKMIYNNGEVHKKQLDAKDIDFSVELSRDEYEIFLSPLICDVAYSKMYKRDNILGMLSVIPDCFLCNIADLKNWTTDHFDRNIHCAEDTLFLFRYLCTCKKVSFIKEAPYNYIKRTVSATTAFHVDFLEAVYKKVDLQCYFFEKILSLKSGDLAKIHSILAVYNFSLLYSYCFPHYPRKDFIKLSRKIREKCLRLGTVNPGHLNPYLKNYYRNFWKYIEKDRMRTLYHLMLLHNICGKIRILLEGKR